MTIARHPLRIVGIVLAGTLAAFGAAAEETKPFDFKPLIPPVFPVPPNSQVQSGSVGGTQTPTTTAPLQGQPQSPTQTAPGVRFSIPAR